MEIKKRLIVFMVIMILIISASAFTYINFRENTNEDNENSINIDEIDKDKIVEKVGLVSKEKENYYFITENERYLILNSHTLSEEILASSEDVDNKKLYNVHFKNQGKGEILYISSSNNINDITEENVGINKDFGEIDISIYKDDGIISMESFFDESNLNKDSIKSILILLGGQVKRTKFQKYEVADGSKYYMISMYPKTLEQDKDSDTIFDLVYNVDANSKINEGYISNISISSITNYDESAINIFLEIYKDKEEKIFLKNNLSKVYESYLQELVEQHIETSTLNGHSIGIDVGNFGGNVYISIINSKEK